LADIDTVVIGAVDRATDGFVSYSQVIEQLTRDSQTLDPSPRTSTAKADDQQP
jgi:hypothetical protein